MAFPAAQTAPLARFPDVADALARVWSEVDDADAALRALCEVRVAQILGTAEFASSLSGHIETRPENRALVTLIDQWLVDVSSVTDEMVNEVRDLLGDDGLMDFVHLLLGVEQRHRLAATWRLLGLDT